MDISLRRIASPSGGEIAVVRSPGAGSPIVSVEPMLYLPAGLQMELASDVEFNDALAAGQPFVMFDWRGRGDSSPLPPGATFDELVRDVIAVLEAAGPPCDVYTWGPEGHIAAAAAVARPDLVRRMLLLNVPFAMRRDHVPNTYRTITSALTNDPRNAMTLSLMQMHDVISEVELDRLSRAWAAGFRADDMNRFYATLNDRGFDSLGDGLPVPCVVARSPRITDGLTESARALKAAGATVIKSRRSGAGFARELRRLWDEHCPVAGPVSVPGTQTDALTSREREVLALVSEGLTNEQIASRLVIAVATARRHVSNIYAKLGVENRAQAVAVAIREGQEPSLLR